MIDSRRALYDMTGVDFGYNLKAWHDYLMLHRNDGSSLDSYGWIDDSIPLRVERLSKHPAHLALAKLAAEADPNPFRDPPRYVEQEADAADGTACERLADHAVSELSANTQLIIEYYPKAVAVPPGAPLSGLLDGTDGSSDDWLVIAMSSDVSSAKPIGRGGSRQAAIDCAAGSVRDRMTSATGLRILETAYQRSRECENGELSRLVEDAVTNGIPVVLIDDHGGESTVKRDEEGHLITM